MTNPASKPVVLGFLTVIENDGKFRGGYLLLNEFGRPLEFHYTSELSFGRQDRILYGAQFEPFVFAEVIAKPMTDRQNTAPRIVLVDRSCLLALRTLIPAPVVFLSASGERPRPEQTELHPAAHVHSDFPQDFAAFDKIRELTPANFDWLEPFERLREALDEIRDPAPISMAG